MELEHLGWNASTASFVAILAITLVRGIGLFDQARRVWVERSTTALSISTFLLFTAAFVVSFIYGWFTRSLALMVALSAPS